MWSKRALQLAVLLGSCVPILAGGAGTIWGQAIIENATPPSLSIDSHFRYLSGLLLGIGLAYWTTVPNIERHGIIFRVLTVIVFIGGTARLAAAVSIGMPNASMQFGLVMELLVTPLLALWQWRISKQYRA